MVLSCKRPGRPALLFTETITAAINFSEYNKCYTTHMVKLILHIEGLVMFLVALYFYQYFQGNWWLFILLLFTPDISMLGYLKDKRIGAIMYNLMHNYILAVLVVITGEFVFNNNLVTLLGIILVAHVGLDRFLGYGLKYPTDFKHTHLQKV